MFVKTFSRLLLRLTVQAPGEQRTVPAPRTLAMTAYITAAHWALLLTGHWVPAPRTLAITAYITAAHWAGSLSKSYN